MKFLYYSILGLFFSSGSFGQTVMHTEQFTSSAAPSGWLVLNNAYGNSWSFGATVGGYTGPGSTGTRYMGYVANDFDAETYAFTPAFALIPEKKYRVKFFQRTESATELEKIKVTVGAGQTIAAQTVSLLDLQSVSNTNYVERTTDWFTPTTSGNFNFAFNCYSSSNNGGLRIDYVRIEWDYVPCPEASNLTVTNVTNVSAQLNWIAPANPPFSGYEWAVTTSSTPPSSGNTVSATTATVTGLAPLTNYYAHVRAKCQYINSPWITTPFSTLGCAPANQCTYKFKLFESFGDGWDGGIIAVKQGGITIDTLEMPINQTELEVLVPICPNIPLEVRILNCGSNYNEIGLEIRDNYGLLIYDLGFGNYCPSDPVLYAGTPTCYPTFCLNPSFPYNNSVITGVTTATLNWLPPSFNPPGGYEYALTTGAPPISWTSTTATTASFTGLSAGTNYQFYVRADCIASLSDSIIRNFTTLGCNPPIWPHEPFSNLTAYAVTGTWLPITNGGYTSGYEYAVTEGALPTTWTSNGTANSVSVTGLTPNTNYTLFLRTECGEAESAHTSRTFTTLALPPINDEHVNAILLQVDSLCPATLYTNVGATTNASEPGAACTYGKDAPVWFKFVAPASGSVKVSTDYTGGSLDGSRLAIYTNDLSTIISCDNNGGHLTYGSSVLYAMELTPGATYKIVVDSDNHFSGTFCVTVESMHDDMLALEGDCGDDYQFIPHGYIPSYQSWIPLLDNESKLVAMVRDPNGGNQEFTVKHNVHNGPVRQDGSNQYYLNRNFSINSTETNVEVMLFFTDDELLQLHEADPDFSLATAAVTRVPGTICTPNFEGAPNSQFLTQTGNGTIGNTHYIKFVTPSFSNFFIHGGLTALPIELKSFTGLIDATSNQLFWETATEVNVREFILERSLDGKNDWIRIGTKTAVGNSTSVQNYSLDDVNPIATAFYRLRIVGNDGKIQFSKIVFLARKSDQFRVVSAFPNPTSDKIMVQFETLEEGSIKLLITDIAGRAVMAEETEAQPRMNNYELSIGHLPIGLYLLTIDNNQSISAPIQIVKQ